MKITEDIDLNLRFYVSILQSYLEYLKVPDKELINSWHDEMKPFLLDTYPFQQNGIFNVNADIKYLIKEIDSLISKSKYIINNKKNLEKNKILSNENNQNLQEQEEFENDLEIMKIDDEEELNSHKNNNNLNINNTINDNCKTIKRTNSVNDLKAHSSTISSKSTAAVSIYDELNNKADDLRSSYSHELTLKAKVKEITPYFSDEFETEGVTIVHKKNIMAQMTLNLFLKKIVVGNYFNDDNFEYTINFTEQCFYFLKRDIVFKKIINCYKYYTELKVPFIQRKNLIHLMNILVIKMYECFTKLESHEDILSVIKNFYNNLIKELQTIIPKLTKKSTKIQDFFYGGIQAIKTGVNNINKNIKENFENKIKDMKGQNDNNKEIKKEENIKNIKDNLNIIYTKMPQKKEEEQHKQKINNTKKEEVQNDENNNKEKEGKMIPEEELLFECEKIVSLFKTDVPKQEILNQTEQSLYFYKLKIKYQSSKKTNNSKNSMKTLKKCSTARNLLIITPEEDIKNPREIYVKKPYFSCLNYEAKDIGEELLYISQMSLNKIKRKELYNGAFLKKSKLITSPNIVDNINKFNNLISFIIEDILSYDYPKDRAKIIERWANIADYCKKRRDYNEIFAINSAFKNYIIVGLDLTWKELGNKTKKIIKELDIFCSFEGNYRNVREDMKLIGKNDFYTPYLGLLLKDLNFYEENYKYLVNGNLINFEKINGVQNSIEDFFHFQKTVDKKKVNLLKELNFFENLESQKESYLENLAGKLEPKFTLYMNPKKVKRLTYIDKKYFKGHSGKGMLSNSVRFSIS